MEIKTISTPITTKVESVIVKYSEEDIKNMILDDCYNRGMVVKSIKFITDYGYVSDEWGMNNHLTSWFKGVHVELAD